MLFNFNYHIGEYYKYPEPEKKSKFRLKEVRGFIFHFYCGHWVSDSIFADMVSCKTGIQVYQDNQLELFQIYKESVKNIIDYKELNK